MAASTGGLPEAITNLAQHLLSEDAMRDILTELTTSSVERVPGCDHASMTLRWNKRFQTMATSDGIGLELDAAQYETDEGPCLHAIRTNEIVAIEDIAVESRFPGFLDTARSLGIGSTLSFPVAFGDEVFGSLNLYARESEAYTADVYPLVSGIAYLAGLSAATANARAEFHEVAKQVAAALESRGIIEQAKGIVMARQSIDAEAAFAVLRSASQQQNRKLFEVASEVVANVATSEA